MNSSPDAPDCSAAAERSRSCRSDDRGRQAPCNVEQIHVAHKTGVEECCLIRGGLAAPINVHRPEPVFLELFAQRLEGLSWQCSDGADKAVQILR